MIAIENHTPEVAVAPLCKVLSVARATYYRRRRPPAPQRRERSRPPRSLSTQERSAVLERLNSERFADQAPAQVYAALLDDGEYLCSTRTMYRILDANKQVRERRDQLRHPEYKKPELVATAPNQVWSWDITKLLGPEKWTYFHLYVVLDIYSRYVVGWMLAWHESAPLARRLLAETCAKQGVQPGELTVHADRGTAMTSKCLAQKYAELGVASTHSRPHVSNDNPFSEAQFKTMKYRPDYPDRFGGFEHAHAHCRQLFDWYNREHRHSALGLLTPEQVHHRLAEQVVSRRDEVLRRAHTAHPERFGRGMPHAAMPPAAVWINPPAHPRAAVEVVTPQRDEVEPSLLKSPSTTSHQLH